MDRDFNELDNRLRRVERVVAGENPYPGQMYSYKDSEDHRLLRVGKVTTDEVLLQHTKSIVKDGDLVSPIQEFSFTREEFSEAVRDQKLKLETEVDSGIGRT